MALALFLLALPMVALVATDAARRERNWLAWATLVAATGGIGLVIWFIVRRRFAPAAMPLTPSRQILLSLASVPILLLMIIVGTFTLTFLFQLARIEGHAMEPTLADRDRVVVNKVAYQLGEPQLGDIVMLYYPLSPEKVFVKRLIAGEGDQVRIVKGRVYRNEVPINDHYVIPAFRDHDYWGPQVIPEGYYFVMGDHRNNSLDSRHWGFVPQKYVLGKVQYRWWPLGNAKVF